MKLFWLDIWRIRKTFEERSFKISTSIFIAQELLLPNYLSFSDFCGDTELRIEAGMSLVDFDTESIDAAIRFGTGDWPNITSQKLCDILFAPVCSPDYLVKNPIQQLADLQHHRLITTSSLLKDWGPWGLGEGSANQDKMVCDSYMATIKSAAEGLGVAMALFPITNAWVNKGFLASPLTKAITTPYAYWVCAPGNNPHPATDAFFEWSKSLFEQIPNIDNSD